MANKDYMRVRMKLNAEQKNSTSGWIDESDEQFQELLFLEVMEASGRILELLKRFIYRWAIA